MCKKNNHSNLQKKVQVITNNNYMCKRNNHSLLKCTGDNKRWWGGASCSLRWSRGTLACLVTDKDRKYSLIIDENNVILYYIIIDNGAYLALSCNIAFLSFHHRRPHLANSLHKIKHSHPMQCTAV